MVYGDYKRQREIFPATPFLFLQNRNSNPEWTDDGFVVWNTEAVNTQDFKYKLNEEKIFILTTGFYEIIYELSFFIESDAGGAVDFVIYRNLGRMDGSQTYKSGDIASGTVTCHYYLSLNKGDYIRLARFVHGVNTTIYIIQNAMRLIIKFLPNQGWNNLHAGAENYRGGTSR